MEYLTVKVIRSEFEANRASFTEVDYKEVSFKDDFFKGDLEYEKLKNASTKAYKQLKEYEFKKRNKC